MIKLMSPWVPASLKPSLPAEMTPYSSPLATDHKSRWLNTNTKLGAQAFLPTHIRLHCWEASFLLQPAAGVLGCGSHRPPQGVNKCGCAVHLQQGQQPCLCAQCAQTSSFKTGVCLCVPVCSVSACVCRCTGATACVDGRGRPQMSALTPLPSDRLSFLFAACRVHQAGSPDSLWYPLSLHLTGGA